MKAARLGTLLLGYVLATSACFGVKTPQRRYYVLQSEPIGPPQSNHIPGLLRVRDLDAESTYDKFQFVVRRSPFELTYQELNVWAVKPSRMISDEIARSLTQVNLFTAVTRELGERRPEFVMSGILHAIEIYDSDDMWFAHLALSLNLTRFPGDETFWTYHFDERKRVSNNDFAHGVRALSELLSTAIAQAMASMPALEKAPTGESVQPSPPPAPPAPIAPQIAPPNETHNRAILVPETPVKKP